MNTELNMNTAIDTVSPYVSLVSLVDECPLLFNKAGDLEFVPKYIECGYGWIKPLTKLCHNIERLNNLCKKVGIVVVAIQIKEKFGTLRFYYDIVHVKTGFAKFMSNLYYKIKPDFKTILVSDVVDLTRVLTIKPTKHIMLWKVLRWFKIKITSLNAFMQKILPIRKRYSKSYGIAEIVDVMIDVAEAECFDVCELCGKTIGTKEEPRKKTSGWIRYICKDCYSKK